VQTTVLNWKEESSAWNNNQESTLLPFAREVQRAIAAAAGRVVCRPGQKEGSATPKVSETGLQKRIRRPVLQKKRCF